jgi:hypothetical protein
MIIVSDMVQSLALVLLTVPVLQGRWGHLGLSDPRTYG